MEEILCGVLHMTISSRTRPSPSGARSEELAARSSAADARPCIRGKFLWAGDEKLYIKGVSYGAFRPDAEGREYHDLTVIERDFALIAASGINTVRIPHTMPPRTLLDV